MTNYSTNTESESYEAADLARIALQAAIDAVEDYQARNGVCDAPFRCVLHVDNGNEADREVSGPRPMSEYALTRHDGSSEPPVPPFLWVRVVYDSDSPYQAMHEGYAGSFIWDRIRWYRVAENNREGRVPDGVQKHHDGWIRHDGGECPVHPMDFIEWWHQRRNVNVGGRVAKHNNWLSKGWYRPLRDPDGVPYCSADGLEDWAEYVATDEDGAAWQFSYKPTAFERAWDYDGVYVSPVSERDAPEQFANTRDHWTNTLRRVYRREDT